MAPQVPGLFYATKLQASLAWWKQPLNFASKKVVRYIEHGVKVEFKKGLPFAPFLPSSCDLGLPFDWIH